ncbi:multiple epidermal growth factor-like domains protein 10 [Mya arenaria]|uniref:multiple epidermal growth factor-like domains protein 10 n=1 Tax=Mya arenaria TaxID=6604 RepID=UPI0022E92461|nr:multiple epidermal growth factor-like domains protein 10 [Mya arenaria]
MGLVLCFISATLLHVIQGQSLGPCSTSVPCSDPAASCNLLGLCECSKGYTAFEGACHADGDLHGTCSTKISCVEANTECDTKTTKKCICSSGYTAYQGSCYTDGSLHGGCSSSVSCTDANTECVAASGSCECTTGYKEDTGACVQAQLYMGSCNTTSQCSDPGAQCDMAAEQCVCKDGYTAFSSSDICWQDGTLNGTCSDVTGPMCNVTHTTCHSTLQRCTCDTDYNSYDGECYADGELHGRCSTTVSCIDANTTCDNVSSQCECEAGFDERNGFCLQVGVLGGACSLTSACTTTNTECGSSRLCVCRSGYSQSSDNCKQDGTLHGACSGFVACADSNTECSLVSGTCQCATGFLEENGKCVETQLYLGSCNTTSPCSDPGAKCDMAAEQCVCKDGHTAFSSSDICWQDGTLNGTCFDATGPTCTVTHTTCHSTLQRCTCDNDYTPYDGKCRAVGVLDGACSLSLECTTTNTECGSSGLCVCRSGYSPNSGNCIQVGAIGSSCTVASNCLTNNSECGIAGLCVCLSGYSLALGECKKDIPQSGGSLGNPCVNSACIDANAVCGSEEICICADGYKESGGVCEKDGIPTYVIVGIVLGAVAIAAVIGLGLLIYCLYSKSQQAIYKEEAKAPLPDEYMLDKTDAVPSRKPKLSALNATPREPLDITAIRRDAPAPLPAIRPLNGGATVPHVNHAPIVAQRPRDVYRGRRLLENEEMEAGLYKQKQRGDFNEYQPYKPWEKTPEKYNIAPNSSRKAKGHGRKNVHKEGGETVEEMEEKYQRRLRKLQRAKMRLLTALTLKSKQTNEKKNKKYESDDFEVSDAGTPDDSDEITEEQELERFKEKHWQKRRRMLGKARVGIMDTDRDGAPPYYVSGGGLNQYFYAPGRQQSRDITPHYVPDYEHLRGLTPNVYAPYGQMHMGNQN